MDHVGSEDAADVVDGEMPEVAWAAPPLGSPAARGSTGTRTTAIKRLTNVERNMDGIEGQLCTLNAQLQAAQKLAAQQHQEGRDLYADRLQRQEELLRTVLSRLPQGNESPREDMPLCWESASEEIAEGRQASSSSSQMGARRSPTLSSRVHFSSAVVPTVIGATAATDEEAQLAPCLPQVPNHERPSPAARGQSDGFLRPREPPASPARRSATDSIPLRQKVRAVEMLRQVQSRRLLEAARSTPQLNSISPSQLGSSALEEPVALQPPARIQQQPQDVETEGFQWCPAWLQHPSRTLGRCFLAAAAASSRPLQCAAWLQPPQQPRRCGLLWLVPALAAVASAVWQLLSGLAFHDGPKPLLSERIQGLCALSALVGAWARARRHREARESLRDLGQRWAFSTTWDRKAAASASLLWALLGLEVALKLYLMYDMQLSAMEVAAFAGSSGTMIVGIFAVRQSCEGLLLLIDGYCSQLHSGTLTVEDAKTEWVLVEACLGEFSAALGPIAVPLFAAFVAGMTSLAAGTFLLDAHLQVSLMPRVPSCIVLVTVPCLLAVIGRVNQKIFEVPGFANSLRNNVTSNNEQVSGASVDTLIASLSHSRAGLFIFDTRFTGLLLSRVLYLTGAGCWVVSHLSLPWFLA